MTQQDDITQRVLTDEQIMRSAISACDSLNITRFHEIGAPSKTIMDDAGLLELGRAVESAVLSKLRAPVADERAALIALCALEADGKHADESAIEAWERARAALASAPVARNADELSDYERGFAAGWDQCVASAPVAGEAVALELRGVPETIKEGDGFWRSCTGCHELNEGRDTGPYSAVLGCHLGQGCSECGGIGAIWDSTDYQAMADDMARSMGQSVSAAPQASAEAFDFVAHLVRQAEFSARTFGPGARVAGVCDHIRKELIEVETSGGDLKEWVDVIILGLDGAWRSGATPQQIIAAIVAKQAKNEARTWPDWRTVDPNKAIEHQRTAAPCTCPSGDGSLRHPCPMHPGADKDGAEQALKDLVTHGISVQRIAPADFLAGGQQRAAFDHPVFAFLLGEGQLHGVDFGERAPGAVGKWWWRKDLRAALSATQAEQGERDAG